MWLIVELASASRFELPSNVFLAFHYVNYLFIPNPQGQRLFPNSMTTVVQSAVHPFNLTSGGKCCTLAAYIVATKLITGSISIHPFDLTSGGKCCTLASSIYSGHKTVRIAASYNNYALGPANNYNHLPWHDEQVKFSSLGTSTQQSPMKWQHGSQ